MDNNTDLLYFNRHWNRFFNSCDITQLQNHYKLPTKKNEKKKIYLDKQLDYCLLYIDYAYNINTGNDYVMKLPAEIIDIVESYAHKFIKSTVGVLFLKKANPLILIGASSTSLIRRRCGTELSL